MMVVASMNTLVEDFCNICATGTGSRRHFNLGEAPKIKPARRAGFDQFVRDDRLKS